MFPFTRVLLWALIFDPHSDGFLRSTSTGNPEPDFMEINSPDVEPRLHRFGFHPLPRKRDSVSPVEHVTCHSDPMPSDSISLTVEPVAKNSEHGP